MATYKSIKVQESAKEKFTKLANMLKESGIAKNDSDAIHFIMESFESNLETKRTQNKATYTSEEKAEIFVSLIYGHNEKEASKRKTDKKYTPNYIAINKLNFIVQEINLNMHRVNAELREKMLNKMAEQAKKLKFDGSENLNPVISERKEFKLKTRIVKKRPFVQDILKNSIYSKIFGY